MTLENTGPRLTFDNRRPVLGIEVNTAAIEEQLRLYQEGLQRFLTTLGTADLALRGFAEAFWKLPVRKDKPILRHTKALLTKNIHILPKETGNGRSRSRSKARSKDHSA
jgi:hypothetical protein